MSKLIRKRYSGSIVITIAYAGRAGPNTSYGHTYECAMWLRDDPRRLRINVTVTPGMLLLDMDPKDPTGFDRAALEALEALDDPKRIDSMIGAEFMVRSQRDAYPEFRDSQPLASAYLKMVAEHGGAIGKWNVVFRNETKQAEFQIALDAFRAQPAAQF